jgi:hypothetical protein
MTYNFASDPKIAELFLVILAGLSAVIRHEHNLLSLNRLISGSKLNVNVQDFLAFPTSLGCLLSPDYLTKAHLQVR